MPDDAMVERMLVGSIQHRSSGGRCEAVEHDGHSAEARRHDRPGDGGEFEPAQPAQHVEWVAIRRTMAGDRFSDDAPLRLESGTGDARSGPVHISAPPPKSPPHRAAAAVVLPMPISPSARASIPGSTAIIP